MEVQSQKFGDVGTIFGPHLQSVVSTQDKGSVFVLGLVSRSLFVPILESKFRHMGILEQSFRIEGLQKQVSLEEYFHF